MPDMINMGLLLNLAFNFVPIIQDMALIAHIIVDAMYGSIGVPKSFMKKCYLFFK